MRYTRKWSLACQALLYASLVLVAFPLDSRALFAQQTEAISESILPARNIIAGEQVELKGKNFSALPPEVTVVIGDRYLVSATVKGDSLFFGIPPEAVPGTYELALQASTTQTGFQKLEPKLPLISAVLQFLPGTRLPDAMPGDRVQINVTNLRAPPENFEIVLDRNHRVTRLEEETPPLIAFRVPDDMPPGRYSVSVESTTEPRRSGIVPGELRVLPKGPPKITAITPFTGYPGQGGKFSFEITGENFALSPQDNEIRVNGIAISRRNDNPCKDLSVTHFQAPCVRVGPGNRTLAVFGYDTKGDHGPAKVQVVAHGQPSLEHPTLFARIPSGWVLPLAFAVSLLVTFMLIAIVWKGIGRYRIGGEAYTPFSVFFLDKATNTYSLSKFQLLFWTGAAVFGYFYLLFANLFIQWKFAFPDLPDGLPLLMGISAGTTVTAIGITNQFGGKGSGPIAPSMADFITTGGLIAPDRFQFFIWTIVGIIGFIALLIAADPATLSEMPKLPDNFLTIMGISSAAYLGGKAVRKGGPVVKSFSIKGVWTNNSIPAEQKRPDRKPPPRGPYLTINMKGDNLDTKGTLKLDDKVLRTDQFWIVPRAEPQPPATTSGELDVNLDCGLIDEANPKLLLERTHTLALVNQDGQSASITFPADPLAISGVEPQVLPAGSTNTSLKVTGENYGGEMTVTWKDAANTETELKPLTKIDDHNIRVTVLNAGPAGSASLVLVSQLGLRASTSVKVINSPTISSITPDPVTPFATNVVLTVSGGHFADGMTAKWKDAGANAEIDLGATTKIDDDNVKVTLPNAGPAGLGTLTLTSEGGAAASKSVTVG